ncbi:MAG: flippase-like domain-containing protein [Limisphaerales bacterium]
MKVPWRWIAFLLGLGIFAWMLYSIGPQKVWANVARLGWAAVLVPFPFLVVYMIDALGWVISFGRHKTGIAYPGMLRIRWAGEAINYILPTAYVGGEAVKVYLLHKRGVSHTVSGSAAVVSKSCQTLAMVIFIAVGAVAALPYLPVGSPAKQGMMTVACLAFGGIAFLLWMQQRGFLIMWLNGLRRIGVRIAALDKRRSEFEKMDDGVRQFYRQEKPRFFATTLVFFVGWMADTLEIFLVAYLLGVPLDWQQAIALEAFIAVAKAIGMFSPGSMGVQEIGVVFLFKLFGLPEELGVAYALIRRGREFVFGFIGWGFIVAEEHSVKELQQHMEQDQTE